MQLTRSHPALDRPGKSRSYGNDPGRVQVLAALGLAMLCVGLVVGAPLRAATPDAPVAVRDAPVKIVALGDSLSAGYGLPAADAFPAKLARALAAKGEQATIENAGVSGDTTSDGLARIDWSVPEGTDAVILELGANDALRGIDPKITRDALEAIVRRLRERKIVVLLAGMQAPRNMGRDYVQAFDAIYPALAQTYDLVFYPFFLDGVAVDAALNQADGLHPTAAGVEVIVSRILPKVEELIARVRSAKS